MQQDSDQQQVEKTVEKKEGAIKQKKKVAVQTQPPPAMNFSENASAATKLLEKRRKMYEVNEQYDQQKGKFKEKEEEFKKKEDSIKEKDLEIQEQLIHYCKFLQENEAKKARAEKRLLEEEKARKGKEIEIIQLSKKQEELKEKAAKFEQRVQQLKRYEDYLEQVQKSNSDQYSDISEIQVRYKTLIFNTEQLRKDQNKMEAEYQQLKKEFTRHEKDKNDEIVQLNNTIKELQKKIEEKEMEKMNQNSVVEQTAQISSQKNLKQGRVFMAIDNLYASCMSEQMAKIKLMQDKQEELAAQKAGTQNQNQNLNQTTSAMTGNNSQFQQNQSQQPLDDTAKKIIKGKQRYEIEIEEDDNDNSKFRQQCEQSLVKLRTIGYFMSDFQKIIDTYSTTEDKKKGHKKKVAQY